MYLIEMIICYDLIMIYNLFFLIMNHTITFSAPQCNSWVLKRWAHISFRVSFNIKFKDFSMTFQAQFPQIPEGLSRVKFKDPPQQQQKFFPLKIHKLSMFQGLMGTLSIVNIWLTSALAPWLKVSRGKYAELRVKLWKFPPINTSCSS